jgi:hypothetical protein
VIIRKRKNEKRKKQNSESLSSWTLSIIQNSSFSLGVLKRNDGYGEKTDAGDYIK